MKDSNFSTWISEQTNKFNMKLLLFFHITSNQYPKNINHFKLIKNYSEIDLILSINKKEIINCLYFNKTNIHEILYEEEKLIGINFNEDKNNLAYYFYLDLLIQDNADILNYEYNIDFIDKINSYQNGIDKSLQLKKILVSKITLDLINNYKSSDIYNCEKDDEKLNYIETTKKSFINDNIKYFQDFVQNHKINLLNEKIDKIYSYIIKGFLEQKKYSNIKEIKNIINQLDLEIINLTETMLDEISEIFNKNNEFINENKIQSIRDFNIKKINFYYFLFKYIFKNSMYIYNIPFLLQTRKSILKSYSHINPNLNLLDEYSLEQLYYILKRIIDSEFYWNKIYNWLNNKNTINKELNFNLVSSVDGTYFNSKGSSIIRYEQSDDDEEETNEIPLINNKYQIIEFRKILEIKYKYTAEYVKEINDNEIIIFGGDKKINILSGKNDFKPKITKECPDWINNILYEKKEAKNENIIIVTKNNLYNLLDGKKQEMKKFYKRLNYNDNNKYDISFILNINQKDFIVCFSNQKKSLLIKDLLNRIILPDTFTIEKGFFKEGIQIDDKIICLTSNKVMSEGEDKIIFYDIKSSKVIKVLKNFSFSFSYTGLCLISLKDNNKLYKFLICACKKYAKGQKNGILIINNLDLIGKKDYNKKDNVIFYKTDNFEVNCFCHILINKNSNIFNINEPTINDNLILVGGFDRLRKRGCIKLFKMNLIENKCLELEEIQEIRILESNKFRFNGPISCITQMNNGMILATCWDGNVYSFDIPNLELLLALEKEF